LVALKLERREKRIRLEGNFEEKNPFEGKFITTSEQQSFIA